MHKQKHLHIFIYPYTHMHLHNMHIYKHKYKHIHAHMPKHTFMHYATYICTKDTNTVYIHAYVNINIHILTYKHAYA